MTSGSLGCGVRQVRYHPETVSTVSACGRHLSYLTGLFIREPDSRMQKEALETLSPQRLHLETLFFCLGYDSIVFSILFYKRGREMDSPTKLRLAIS